MNQSNAPKISTVLCVYNGERTLMQAVESLLAQTLKDFELIIVNDGSADGTLALLNQLKDPRIIIQSIPHSGLARALNYGLKLCRGDLIARMDADDIALPKRFERQASFLNEHPEVALAGTAYEILSEDGTKKRATVPLIKSDNEIKKALPKFNPFHHGSVMVRKKILSEVGGYDEELLLSQDYDLWFRISKNYKMANLNEVLMLRREGRETLKKERKQNWFALKARLKAIREGNSSLSNAIHLFRPLLIILTPDWLKSSIRKLIRKTND